MERRESGRAIKQAEGSVQGIERFPPRCAQLYRTAWESRMRSIDMAAARGAFIDQSQSLNLFVEAPTIGKLSSMYMYAWKQGLKTTYYLRSRPATRIAKTHRLAVEPMPMHGGRHWTGATPTRRGCLFARKPRAL